MKVLALVTGDYGHRHVQNMERHLLAGWQIATWQTPTRLPIVLDYYDEWLPNSLDPADLILSLAELPGVAELIPDLAKLCGAKAVIAPIDSQAWLPFGLARQLREWLVRIDVACVTPMPFCAFTENTYNALRLKQQYDSSLPGYDLIADFCDALRATGL